jgi:hypothetical protein
MTEQEAAGCRIGNAVEYQGQRATIVWIFRHPGVARDGFHARFHVRTAHGADYHDVDYPDLTLISEA